MSEEEKKQPFPEGAWQHDQQVGFKKIVPHLEKIRDALQNQINHEKAKLSQMVNARDSIRRK
jgi:hypothetical protein